MSTPDPTRTDVAPTEGPNNHQTPDTNSTEKGSEKASETTAGPTELEPKTETPKDDSPAPERSVTGLKVSYSIFHRRQPARRTHY
jgi:hypothetical protein